MLEITCSALHTQGHLRDDDGWVPDDRNKANTVRINHTKFLVSQVIEKVKSKLCCSAATVYLKNNADFHTIVFS